MKDSIKGSALWKAFQFQIQDLSLALALLKVKSTMFSVEGSIPTPEAKHDSLAMAKSLLDVLNVFRTAIQEIDSY